MKDMYSKKEVVELFNEFSNGLVLDYQRSSNCGTFNCPINKFNDFLKEKGLIEQFEGWTKGNSKYLAYHKDGMRYGFDFQGNWFGLEPIKFVTALEDENPATPKEVETALIKEAKKRGFKEGVRFQSFGGRGKHDMCFTMDGRDIIYDNNSLIIHSENWGWRTAAIFKDGKWAEIVEDKKEGRWSFEGVDDYIELPKKGSKEAIINFLHYNDVSLNWSNKEGSTITINGETYIKK
jgi:hypothetical protein